MKRKKRFTRARPPLSTHVSLTRGATEIAIFAFVVKRCHNDRSLVPTRWDLILVSLVFLFNTCVASFLV